MNRITNKPKVKKDKDYYLNLPWTYTVEPESHQGVNYYIIRVNELPGICTDCERIDQGMEDIKQLIDCAIDIYLENGKRVPEPINRRLFKGNIAYRTDSKRHYRIALLAKYTHKSISKTLDDLIDTGLLACSLND